MNKRIFSLLLALVLCLSLAPMAAFAASDETLAEPAEEPVAETVEEPAEEPAEEPVEEPVEEAVEEPAEEPVALSLDSEADAVPLEGDTTLPDWVDNSNQNYYKIQSSVTNITLTGDVTLTGKMLVIDKAVTLNLNGYTLAVNGYLFSEDSDWETRTLQINSGCTLTLTDSSEAKSGKLSLDNGLDGRDFPTTATLYGTLNANGGTITADTYGIIQCTSGIIQCTGASATDFDILVDLYGGTISGGNFNRNVRAASGGTISGGMFYGDIDSSCTIANGSHKITFFKETTDSTPYATEVVVSGKTTTAPREPKKAHFIFEGWIDENGAPYTFGSALTADVTLYANWTPAPLATMTKAPEAKTGLVYGSYDGYLVTPGAAEGGKMVYIMKDGDGNAYYPYTYSENTPNMYGAGTYCIYYKVAADDDHTDSAEYGPIIVTVAPKKVTISGITAKNKVYDGTTDVELYGWRNVKIEGVEPYSNVYVATVEGAFADADAGVGKTIVISKLTLGGDNLESYVFDMPVVTAAITPKEVTVSGIRAEDKTYDGNTAATLKYDDATISGTLEGDTLTVSATGTFADKNVGEDKTVAISNLTLGGADAGNYKLAPTGQQTETTANIAKAAASATVTGKTGLTYTGEEQELVTASVVVGGRVLYSVNIGDTYEETMPTGKNVGSYIIDWYVEGDSNHESTKTERVTVTIAVPANVGDAVKDMTVDTVTSDDRKTIEDTQKTVDDYLGMEPTESEKTTLNELKTKCEGLIQRLDEVKAAMEDEVITGTDGITKDNVKTSDKKALEDAKAAIEKLLEDYESNLTADEKQTLNDKLERISDALDEIARLEKAAKDAKNKPVKTGDTATPILWIVIAIVAVAAVVVLLVARKKK